jgi:hypothetical protein
VHESLDEVTDDGFSLFEQLQAPIMLFWGTPAAALERRYEAQREAQVKRQALERETAVANLQSDVVKSEQMVRIAQLKVDGDAASIRAVGAAKADAYRQGIAAGGEGGYTAIQLAAILGENKVKLVPDIAVSRDGSGGLVNAMIARLIAAGGAPDSEES